MAAPAVGETIRTAQHRHGLVADGIIGPRTRLVVGAERHLAAVRAATERHTSEPDPFDAASVRAFQRRHGLPASGAIDDDTRAAIRWERDQHLSVDPADAESIRAFQRRHGLRTDGVIGAQTQSAMRAARRERRERRDAIDGDAEARDGDPPAREDGRLLDAVDPDAVRRFQRRHRLTEDGRVGPRTQTALMSVRRERAARDGRGDNHPREDENP